MRLSKGSKAIKRDQKPKLNNDNGNPTPPPRSKKMAAWVLKPSPSVSYIHKLTKIQSYYIYSLNYVPFLHTNTFG